jgi:hypothetical protein
LLASTNILFKISKNFFKEMKILHFVLIAIAMIGLGTMVQ